MRAFAQKISFDSFRVRDVPESRPVRGELEEKPAILVIDDELLVRNVVRMTLSRSGYHVLTASCGEEALKLSRAYPGAIHVAVIDVEWPYVIGTELATTILKEMPRIRVLLMTDKVARGIPLQLHWKLLLKPFLPRELLDRLHQVLRDEQELS